MKTILVVNLLSNNDLMISTDSCSHELKEIQKVLSGIIKIKLKNEKQAKKKIKKSVTDAMNNELKQK